MKDNFLYDVSVITPFFNGNDYLDEMLGSVACQFNYSVEVVICVDYGSEQIAEDVLDKYSFPIKVVYNKGPFGGAGIARNIAMTASRGRYLAFLDVDDLWVKEKLQEQISYMKNNHLVFSFGSYENFSNQGQLQRKPIVVPLDANYTLESFLKKQFVVGCLTVVIDRKYISGFPDITAKKRNDYRLWTFVIMQCDALGLKWGGMSTILGRHRLHKNGLTSNRLSAIWATYHFYRELGMNRFVSTYYWCHNVYRTVINRGFR